MRHARSLRIAFSITCASCMAATVPAQEKIASPVPARPHPAINRAAEALRREAEAGIKERERDFARLKALPPAAAVALPVARIGVEVNRAGVPFPNVPRIEVHLRRGIPLRLALVPAERGAQEEDALHELQFLVSRETFDLYLFGSTGDVESAHAYQEKLLTAKIDVIDRMSQMTPNQKKKLLLAGRGDIKRLLDRVEDERKTFEQVRTDPTRCQEFLIRLQPFRLIIFRGPFGSDSLFAKTLKKIRAEENLVRLEPGLESCAAGR